MLLDLLKKEKKRNRARARRRGMEEKKTEKEQIPEQFSRIRLTP